MDLQDSPEVLELSSDRSTDSSQVTPATVQDHSTVYVPISEDEKGGKPTTSRKRRRRRQDRRRVRLGSSSPESGQPEEQSSGDESENEPGDNGSPEQPVRTFEVEMATEALASTMSQMEEIVEGAIAHTQPMVRTPATPDQSADEDYYARIDALLFRDPQDRSTYHSDYRSTRLLELSTNERSWT